MVAIRTLTWSRYDTISLEWRDTTIQLTLVRTERCGFNSFLGVVCWSLMPASASAWWDEGHMQIAAAAYDRLTPAIRAKVDALIKLNPDYPSTRNLRESGY
jgi:hypothetical protein